MRPQVVGMIEDKSAAPLPENWVVLTADPRAAFRQSPHGDPAATHLVAADLSQLTLDLHVEYIMMQAQLEQASA